MVKCRECEYFRTSSSFELSKFIFVLENDGLGTEIRYPEICFNSNCFISRTKRTPERGEFTYRERIAGQAQLNRNNDCKYFEKKPWWKL